MSKSLYVIALFLLSFVARSQDCANIRREYDKANGRLIHRTVNGLSMGLVKLIDTKTRDTSYYASFDTKGRISGDRKGVTVALLNGNNLVRTEQQTNADVVGDAPNTTTFILLSAQDMKQLATTGVQSVKLSTYTKTMTADERVLFKQLAYCLTFGTSRVP